MTSPANPRATTLHLGPLKLIGSAAVGAIVFLIVWSKPPASSWPMWVSSALWIGFIVYWSIAARGAAPTQSSETVESRRFHVRLLNAAFLLLLLPIPGLRGRLLPSTMTFVAIGLLVQIGSGMLGVWARRILGRNWSGAITVAVDHELVRSGPYRYVRHPIYSAMLGMFVGTAIVSGEWHALIGLLILAIAYARKIRLEEASLRTVFGAAYDEYRATTRAVIPFVV